VKFTTTVDVFAIRFKPDGIYNIFGLPSSMFLDSYEDMSLVLGSDFSDFCSSLREECAVDQMMVQTERYLLRTLTKQRHDISYVNQAAELIRQTPGIRIEELSIKVCISQRQLEREFKAKIGISPKRYLRLIRINEVMNLLNQNHHLTLTSIAHHCGYADQAHFIKDFKRIVGAKPTSFIRQRDQYIANPVKPLNIY
jgi:transcriptional regulator GlxA family with amidase domain